VSAHTGQVSGPHRSNGYITREKDHDTLYYEQLRRRRNRSLSCEQADNIRLRVRPDSHADFAQWFYFRLSGARGERCVMTFENAADCAFAEGWRDYQAVASYDRVNWFRVPTSYDGRVLTIDHTPDFDRVYYAYFEPYSEERHSGFSAPCSRCRRQR
jgi:murein tripeptide amidase MpaA